MSASITASDPYSFDNGSGSSAVSIAKGGSVSFSYPSGMSSHNVVFDTASTHLVHRHARDRQPVPVERELHVRRVRDVRVPLRAARRLMTGTVEVPDPNAPTTGTNPPPTDTGGQPPGGGVRPAGSSVHRP